MDDTLNKVHELNPYRPHLRKLIRRLVGFSVRILMLGLDLYLWLVYRTFPLRAPQRITWRQIYRQFGVAPSRASDNDTVQKFRRKVLRELKKIKLAWPELNYTTARGVLILLPPTPTIAPLNPGQL